MDAIKIKLAKRNREKDPASWEALYEAEIVKKIRAKYTVDQEFAIHRKRDSKPEEFAKYDAYVEACKAEVKAELGITE